MLYYWPGDDHTGSKHDDRIKYIIYASYMFDGNAFLHY
jgi:hypothetical protein